MLAELLTVLFSYLIGCFNTAYYLTKLRTGIDIRAVGSGNAGSRNAGRVMGAGGFLLSLTGDVGKGMAAVSIASHLNPEPLVAYSAMLAVVVGHIWPLQLGFRGGKGFAALVGAMIILAPFLFMTSLLLGIVIYILLRRTTIAGLLALAFSPFVMLGERMYRGFCLISPESVLYCAVIIVVLYAHRTNIRDYVQHKK